MAKAEKNWIPYNNAPLRVGEVLIPQMVDNREYAIAIGAKPENLRTWTKGGVRFTVMFVPVPADQETICKQVFDAAVNEFLDEKLGPNRRSRCMVPQTDGTCKPCPKVKNGNHEPCAICLHRSEYEREDRSIVSLDELSEDGFHPTTAVPSAESVSMEKFLLNDLLEYLSNIDPVLAEITSLGFNGFCKSEIIQQLPLKHTQAYSLCKKAEELTCKFLQR